MHAHDLYVSCRQGSRSLVQVIPKFVSPELQDEANQRMKRILEDSYSQAKAMLARNRPALDALIDELMQHDTLPGDRVREIVEQHANASDLKIRQENKNAFL